MSAVTIGRHAVGFSIASAAHHLSLLNKGLAASGFDPAACRQNATLPLLSAIR